MPDNMDTTLTEKQAETIFRTMRYLRLYEQAYSYPPTQSQVDRSIDNYYSLLEDSTDDLEEVLSDGHYMKELCEEFAVPVWMVTGAPNPATYCRWLTTGRI